MITKTGLAHQLRLLGLEEGQTVMLHVSLHGIGWIVGGPDVLIQALLDVLGPDGTLMMYVSWEEWERVLVFGLDSMQGEKKKAYLEECPPFDPLTSRAQREWSILTEYLRTWPGAYRSDHPTASVAAVGARALWLTENHPLSYGYGSGSPFDKLCQCGGRVLLLGSPINTITLLHHAEHIARIPDKRIVTNRTPVLRNGQRVWVEFEEFDTCDGIRDGFLSEEYFNTIASDYLAAGNGRSGKVGDADSYLFEAAELVRFAVRWMERKWGS
jgi:aminoglycoside 3-N-acetyltransferase